MDNQQNPFGGTLQFKIWVTRGCYFTLADRLNRKARYSVISITILSFYVFVISLVTLVFGSILRATDAQILSTASIILSVFIIIMTLFEYSKNYVADAERSQNTDTRWNNSTIDMKAFWMLRSKNSQRKNSGRNTTRY